MPNKYSHAFVLSNYESHGVFHYDRPRSSKPSPSTSHTSTKSQKPKASSSRPQYTSTPIGAPDRVRLNTSPSPEPEPKSRPPPLHRRSSSAETQIYAPITSITPSPTRNHNDPDALEHGRQHPEDARSSSIDSAYIQNAGPLPKSQVSKPLRGSEPYNLPTDAPKQIGEATKSLESERYASQESPSSQYLIERGERPSTKSKIPKPQRLVMPSPNPNGWYSSAANFGGSKYAPSASEITPRAATHQLKGSQQPLHDTYGKVPLSARAFAPERPPSPPDTPDSGRSFSLSAPGETPDPTSSQPLPHSRSAERGPSERARMRHSTTTSKSIDRVGTSRPKTSPVQISPARSTFSMTTQKSSSTLFKNPVDDDKVSSMCIEPISSKTPLPAFPDEPTFPDDDTDLESLPSNLDFDAMPWCDHNIGPAIFRHGELNAQRHAPSSPVLTRASSFDSAAPPPISLNRQMPPILTEMPPPAIPKTPKKAKTSVAAFSFFRSAPKAILYSQTTPGTPPVPVSVSRTAAPSIPALFPGYKGEFPAQQQQPLAERGSRMNKVSQSKNRGQSVPPRSSFKRKSWFKTDQLDKAFGMVQSDVRRGSDLK